MLYKIQRKQYEGGTEDITEEVISFLESDSGAALITGYLADYQQIDTVFTTGNQNIDGEKTFLIRPNVNGTGVLLEGETSNVDPYIINLDDLTGYVTAENGKTYTYTTGSGGVLFVPVGVNCVFINASAFTAPVYLRISPANLSEVSSGMWSLYNGDASGQITAMKHGPQDYSSIINTPIEEISVFYINDLATGVVINGAPSFTAKHGGYYISESSNATIITPTDTNFIVSLDSVSTLYFAEEGGGVFDSLSGSAETRGGYSYIYNFGVLDKIYGGDYVSVYGAQHIGGVKNFNSTPTVNGIELLLQSDLIDSNQIRHTIDNLSSVIVSNTENEIHDFNGTYTSDGPESWIKTSTNTFIAKVYEQNYYGIHDGGGNLFYTGIDVLGPWGLSIYGTGALPIVSPISSETFNLKDILNGTGSYSPLVDSNSNQNISGVKNFYMRPTVNNSGVALQGESQLSRSYSSTVGVSATSYSAGGGNIIPGLSGINLSPDTYYKVETIGSFATSATNSSIMLNLLFSAGGITAATGVNGAGWFILNSATPSACIVQNTGLVTLLQRNGPFIDIRDGSSSYFFKTNSSSPQIANIAFTQMSAGAGNVSTGIAGITTVFTKL